MSTSPITDFQSVGNFKTSSSAALCILSGSTEILITLPIIIN